MDSERQPGQALLEGPGWMLLSAAIFGYFGFMVAYPEVDIETGATIPMVVALKWITRITAIAFLASAPLSLAAPILGNALYCVVGLASSVALLVVAAWDMRSPYFSGIPPILLVIFAAWNGYGAWTGLRNIRKVRDWQQRGGPRSDGGGV